MVEEDYKFDYIISGYGSSNSGTGRLINYIESVVPNKVKLLYRFNYIKEIKGNYKQRKYFRSLYYLIKAGINILLFYLKTLNLRNSRVLVFHPHSIGLNLFNRLLSRNKLGVYVLDNSFFCMKSYNYTRNEKECFRCIISFDNYESDCTPYPFNYSINRNQKFLRGLKENSSSISFFVQNENQGKLIKKVYGNDTQVELVGMYTGEITSDKIKTLISSKIESSEDNLSNCIILHAGTHEAKGLQYFLKLAILCPQYNFLIPETKQIVSDLTDIDLSNTKNLVFKEMTWETGLQDAVINSKITVCPSLWSAPIEGALVKSIAFAQSVAVVRTKYGLVSEIPEDVVLKLDINESSAAKNLDEFLLKGQNLRDNALPWLLEFQDYNYKRLTSFISNIDE